MPSPVHPTERDSTSLARLAAALGVDLLGAKMMPSGDNRATWRISSTGGTFVVRSGLEPRQATRWVATAKAFAGAGVPTPPARAIVADGAMWLVMDHIHGEPGSSWLDTPERAKTMATSMGALWRSLSRVEGSTIGGPGTARGAGAFVHGDFAPINVLVDARGLVVGLLDLEHGHLGDPLEDIAWWGWVVRHHHPASWEAAWPTFCSAAHLDVTEHGATLRALMLDGLDRRARAASDVRERTRWLGYRDEASGW